MKTIKHSIWVNIVSVVVMIAIVLISVPQPALADETTDIEHDYAVAIHKLEPFLSHTETGNIVLEPPEALVSTIDSEVYQSVLSGLEMTNQMIDGGYLICEDDFSLTTTGKYQEFLVIAAFDPPLPNGAGGGGGGGADYGVTKVVWYWSGLEIYLDHWYVVAIAGGLAIGAVIATLVPEFIASKIAAALIGIAGWWFASYDTYGKGIILTFTYIFPIFFAGIGPQQ